MEKSVSREEAIRQGRSMRRMNAFAAFTRSLLPHPKLKARVEHIDTPFGKARCLLYGFEDARVTPVLFDLHGGGFLLGTADMDEKLNLEFQQRVGCKVISIEYAKAPDHPYPAAVNQVYAVVEHVFECAGQYGIDQQKMAIGGHSAGANLSAVTCMKAKEAGRFQFVCQVLDYPPLDLGTSSFDKPQPKGCIPPAIAQMFDACYIEPQQAKEPYVSPVYATREQLQGLPPAVFILPGMDSLHDEGLRYRDLLRDAGVETECYEYPNAVHGFTLNPSDDTTDAVNRMAAFLTKYLRPVD